MIPVFVISLKDATTRRQSIVDQMQKLSIPFDFIDAVDGRGFDMDTHAAYNKRKRLAFFRQDMTGGELGCLLSHRSIFQKMVDENIERALILEDDAILYDDFYPAFKKLLEAKTPYELARFLYTEKVAKLTQRTVEQIDDTYKLNRLMTTPGGAHAYIITQSGAKKLLKHTARNWLPIDTLIGHCWQTGINAFIVQPGLVAQNLEFESAIGEKRFEKKADRSGLSKTSFPITRALFKLYETIMKRCYYSYKGLKD
jgi:glycosyl transferase family 25